MGAAKRISVERLFPPEVIGERKALLNRFWSGEDIGRPVFIPKGFKKEINYRRCPDPDQAALLFVASLEEESRIPLDSIPYFDCEMWPIATVSAFRGRILRSEKASPWIEPIIHRPEDVYQLKAPNLLDGLVGQAVRNYRRALDCLDGYIPPRLPDMQGPLQVAGMLWKQEDFILAMYDEPETVHHLMGLVTDYLISVYQYFLDNYPDAMMVNWPSCYLPRSQGVGLVEDFAHLLSADLYREFGLPYANRIADRFGGVLIHCCGAFMQHWDTFKQIHNLRGLDTQFPYSHPRKVHTAFPNLVHSMTLDYAEQKRNFSHGDPDAFLKFLLPHTPRSLRWQAYVDVNDVEDMRRQVDFVQANWT